jgi:hypothetical protein
MNWSTPLQRVRRDDRNGYIIHYKWIPDNRVPDEYALEHSRRHRNCHQARVLWTNIIISIALVNCDFLGIESKIVKEE